MLALYGFLTIIVLLFLIMTKRVYVTVALVITPLLFGVLAGFAPQLGGFVMEGILKVAPTGVMLAFAIIYFGMMYDVGLFDPIIKKITKAGGNDPIKVVVGTALIAILTHLDGSGETTFLITIPAMIPFYDRLGIDRRVLACVVALAAGTMNVVPWGGPTLRAATSLNVEMIDLFNPMIPAFIVGLIGVVGVSYWLGRKEKARLGIIDIDANISIDEASVSSDNDYSLKRPKLIWFNAILTIVTIAVLVLGYLPPAVSFMIAVVIGLTVNFHDIKIQQERISSQAGSIIQMITVIFGAGVLTGVLSGTGMITAMTEAVVAAIPNSLGSHFPILTGVTSMPASLLFDPDSYYFGVLPILASASEAMGVPGIEVGRAAILGQMTVGFPVSPLTAATFLLVGLAGVELGDHQKFTIPLAFGISILMVIVAVLIGAISL